MHKNSIYLLTALFLFVIITGCVGLKPGTEGKAARIKAGTEMFIAKDVTNVPPFWCGQGTALVYSTDDYSTDNYSTDDEGIFWHDIETGKTIHVAGQMVIPLQCSPDGKWVIYIDKDSLRAEERAQGEEEKGVVDLLRYELSTGMRQIFAQAYDGVVSSKTNILSPDGTKVFLGKRPKETIEIPEPKWEVIWAEKGDPHDTVWFSDSSGVVSADSGDRRDGNSDFSVEVFSPERKTVMFNPQNLWGFNLLFADRQNRVYIGAWSGHKFIQDIKESILRCAIDIEGGKALCDMVFENSRNISGLSVFLDGETIVYMIDNDNCVRIKKIGEEKGDCITTQRPTDNYTVISPDEKWVAFTASRKRENNSFAQDLYVVKLKE